MANVACSPLAWGKTRTETVLDEVTDAGYAGIEIHDFQRTEFAKQPGRLRGLLEERHLSIAAVPFTGTFFERDTRKDERERLRRLGDFVSETGPGGVCYFRAERHPARRDMMAGEPPLLPLTPDRMASLADTINQLCDACRDFGMTGAFTNRIGSYVETPEEYGELIERTEPDLVKLAPDFGHWFYAGGDPLKLVAEHRRGIIYPKVRDFDQAVFDKVKEEHFGFRHFLRDGGFKALGEGSLDVETILMPFEKAEFGGWVGFELEVSDRAPKETAQASREYLRARLHW